MNTLVAVAIAPFGVGDELAPYVAEATLFFITVSNMQVRFLPLAFLVYNIYQKTVLYFCYVLPPRWAVSLLHCPLMPKWLSVSSTLTIGISD